MIRHCGLLFKYNKILASQRCSRFFIIRNNPVQVQDALVPEKGEFCMISDEQLNEYRLSGEKVRVVRDALESNDVIGIVIAWDGSQVMVRRPNRRVVKLDRNYMFQPYAEPRRHILDNAGNRQALYGSAAKTTSEISLESRLFTCTYSIRSISRVRGLFAFGRSQFVAFTISMSAS